MNWNNCIIDGTVISFNIRVLGNHSGVNLTYLGGTYTNSNSKFSVLGGISTWKNFNVISPRIVAPLLAIGSTHRFENLYVT